MSLHRYQNQNAQTVGIALRTIVDGSITSRSYVLLGPGATIVLENDPKLARPFNPATRNWLPYSVMTDLGVVTDTLSECEDNDTWPV